MKRVIVKTETKDEHGAITSTHREEESQDSGLLEAWGFLALILASLLLALLTYRVVSGMVASRPYTSSMELETYGIQGRQTESAKFRPHPLRAGTGGTRQKRRK